MFNKIKTHFTKYMMAYVTLLFFILIFILSHQMAKDIEDNGGLVKSVTEVVLDIKDEVEDTIEEHESEE